MIYRTLGVGLLLCGFGGGPALAAEKLAFPERFVLRIASYEVRNADADLLVLSSTDNVGTGFNFVDDLGGDEDLSTPRIDISYRISETDRIELSHFRIDRSGRKRLEINLDIGDESFTIGDTVISDLDYAVTKFGYAYSFYRSPEVELSFTAGFNFTDYEFSYSLVDGSSEDKEDASGPIPMFGLRFGFQFNPRWSAGVLTELFFIETGSGEGTFTNYELNLDYRLTDNIMLGFGLARFSIDVQSSGGKWDGRISDTHQGYLISASYYFE